MTIEFGDTRLPKTFWQRCEFEAPTGCWLWTGSMKDQPGRKYKYPNFYYNKRMRVVKQVLAEVFIPDYDREKWQPVLTCENDCCVNPNHLTLKDRTICNRGHQKKPNQMQCLECKSITSKVHHTQNPERGAKPKEPKKTKAATEVGGWKAKNTKKRRPAKSKPIEGFTVFGDEDTARDVWRPPGWSKEVTWWPGLKEPTSQEQSPAKTA